MTNEVDGRRRIRVGSWPGRTFSHNSFVESFCAGLSACDIEVVDVRDPRSQSPQEIDVLHMHWPEQIFWADSRFVPLARGIVGMIVALRRLRRAGVGMVLTVHNLRPHDLSLRQQLMWVAYSRQIFHLVDGFVTLSPGTLPVVREQIAALRDKPGMAAWHPPYTLRQPTISRSQMRKELDLSEDAYCFAFLGMVRPYKGVEELIRAFHALPGDRYRLVIAGEAIAPGYGDKIVKCAGEDSRIRLILRRLTDEEFVNLGAAADIQVLPFLKYLHSGSLVHAVSQHVAAITPRTAFAESLAVAVGRDWVQLYTPPLSPEVLASAKAVTGEPDLGALSPVAASQRLKDFYIKLLGRPQQWR